MSADGTIFDIKRYATHDGPGIRTTVFLTGCPLRCWWCHNPEGLIARPFDANASGARPHARVERGYARRVSVSSVLEEVERDTVFYDQSGGGVTFSGGEPLSQPEFLRALLAACRERALHTAIDTSGHADPETWRSVLGLADLCLFDIKLIDDELHRRYTGVSNARILENYRLLAPDGHRTIIRFPVIPGITETPENINAVLAFLLSEGSAREVSLLPYHRTATAKYERLGVKNLMANTPPLTPARMEVVRLRFEECGFHVKVGG